MTIRLILLMTVLLSLIALAQYNAGENQLVDAAGNPLTIEMPSVEAGFTGQKSVSYNIPVHSDKVSLLSFTAVWTFIDGKNTNVDMSKVELIPSASQCDEGSDNCANPSQTK